MTREQYLLTKLAEECLEVSHLALKCVQFGPNEVSLVGLPDGPDNREKLYTEIKDVQTIMALLTDEFGYKFEADVDYMFKKIKKVDKWYKHSQKCGLVDGR